MCPVCNSQKNNYIAISIEEEANTTHTTFIEWIMSTRQL